jgi:hypothetical protein
MKLEELECIKTGDYAIIVLSGKFERTASGGLVLEGPDGKYSVVIPEHVKSFIHQNDRTEDTLGGEVTMIEPVAFT